MARRLQKPARRGTTGRAVRHLCPLPGIQDHAADVLQVRPGEAHGWPRHGHPAEVASVPLLGKEASVNKVELGLKRKYLREENRKWPDTMTPVTDIPRVPSASHPTKVWRSRNFLAQVFPQQHGAIRVTVNRTELDGAGGWKDGITWDELMQVKDQIGYADAWAVEVYPPGGMVVNVANMRHLWIVAERPAFAWEPVHKWEGP